MVARMTWRRDEMGVALLGHARVGVAEVPPRSGALAFNRCAA
jgi:hypothetical protein